MKSIRSLIVALLIYLFTGVTLLFSQTSATVPGGIHYQAVARGSDGKELVNTNISVIFSITAGSEVGTVVFEEVHSGVTTSKYGVFSLVIGKGTSTGNGSAETINDIDWSTGTYFLKVKVNFGGDYRDMGAMQFLAVPYALYAAKSLEPGPQGEQGEQGPQGEPGDPATDDQTLSVVNVDGSDYLAISGGNQVKISSIEKDGDPTNELQDLRLTSDILTITKLTDATSVNLAPYNQTLSYNSSTYSLGISGNTTTVDLSGLKNDADASPTNEIQTLSYNQSTKELSISGTGGNSVTLGSEVAFRARNTSSDVAPQLSNITLTYDAADMNIGGAFDPSSGVFTAPADGIYTFNISFTADGTGGSRELAIYVNSQIYEKLAIDISSGSFIPVRSVTLRLSASNTVSVTVFTGTALQTGTGSFSGFRVN